MSLKDYIPGEMVVVIGAITVDNFESLTVEKVEDDWTFDSGSAGEETRTLNSSRRTMYTIELQQTNEANLYLSELKRDNPKATTNIGIVDPNGASAHACSRATIQKVPTATYNKTESSTRSWVLIGPEDVNIIGGN